MTGVVGGGGVFFFQAEDGIRASPVTGVQTCALPILTALNPISTGEELTHVYKSLKWRQCFTDLR